jgi:CO/xanthine dehydrogenase Mo-binding subunit
VLGRWLDFGRSGEVTVRVGKVEYGQAIWTALTQVLERLACVRGWFPVRSADSASMALI